MKASEARAILEGLNEAAIEKRRQELFAGIKAAAEQGRDYYALFAVLSDSEVAHFTELGYVVNNATKQNIGQINW